MDPFCAPLSVEVRPSRRSLTACGRTHPNPGWYVTTSGSQATDSGTRSRASPVRRSGDETAATDVLVPHCPGIVIEAVARPRSPSPTLYNTSGKPTRERSPYGHPGTTLRAPDASPGVPRVL